jgi:hypothetical protein
MVRTVERAQVREREWERAQLSAVVVEQRLRTQLALLRLPANSFRQATRR